MAFPCSQQRRGAGKDLRFSKLVFGKFLCQVTLCQELIIFWVDAGGFALKYSEGFADAVSDHGVRVLSRMNHGNSCSFHTQSSASFPGPSPRCCFQNHLYVFQSPFLKVLGGFGMRWEEQKFKTPEFSSHSFHAKQELLRTKQQPVLGMGTWPVSLISEIHDLGIKHHLCY